MTKPAITLLLFTTLILSGMTKTPCPPCKNQQISSIYALAGYKDIGTYDVASSTFTLLSSVTGITLNGLAVTPDNQLYGIDPQRLYSINPIDGSTVTIGLTTRLLQNIAFGPNGILYGIDINNNFCEVSLTTGAASTLFPISGYNDLAYGIIYDPISELFYFTSEDGNNSGSQLATLSLDGTFTLSTPPNPTYILVNGLFLDGETLYGVTVNREQLIIDKTSGEETFDRAVTGTESQIISVTRALTCVSPSRRVLLARKRRLL